MKTAIAKVVYIILAVTTGVMIARADEPRRFIKAGGKTYELTSEKEFERFQKMTPQEIKKLPKGVRNHFMRKLHRKYLRAIKEKNPDKKSEIMAMRELLNISKGSKRKEKTVTPNQFKNLTISHTNKIGDTKIKLESK